MTAMTSTWRNRTVATVVGDRVGGGRCRLLGQRRSGIRRPPRRPLPPTDNPGTDRPRRRPTTASTSRVDRRRGSGRSRAACDPSLDELVGSSATTSSRSSPPAAVLRCRPKEIMSATARGSWCFATTPRSNTSSPPDGTWVKPAGEEWRASDIDSTTANPLPALGAATGHGRVDGRHDRDVGGDRARHRARVTKATASKDVTVTVDRRADRQGPVRHDRAGPRRFAAHQVQPGHRRLAGRRADLTHPNVVRRDAQEAIGPGRRRGRHRASIGNVHGPVDSTASSPARALQNRANNSASSTPVRASGWPAGDGSGAIDRQRTAGDPADADIDEPSVVDDPPRFAEHDPHPPGRRGGTRRAGGA